MTKAKTVKVDELQMPEVVDLFAGGKKVTCSEAAKLLREDKVTKAYFRPLGPTKAPYSDEDMALVWMK